MDTQSEQGKPVKDEFERLGENLRRAVEGAWQSEERKKISEDIQAGIEEFGEALNRTANEFINSPSGQKMSREVDDWSRRVKEGEVGEKVESEVLNVLNLLNQKLEEVISSMASEGAQSNSQTED